MGVRMAGRLLDAGHELTVWNRTPARADPLLARGAQLAADPAGTADGTAAVFTMLSDPQALSMVVTGPGGLGPVLGSTPLVEMSTVGPDAIAELVAGLGPGARVLDAPVLGSLPQAEAGTLAVFAGGDAGLYQQLRPWLEAFGTPSLLGPQGSGAAMKLVVNSCLGVLMTGLGEALELADALGLDQGVVLDVLSESPIGVTARSKRPLIESGHYPANFRLALAVKDVALVVEAARRRGLELEVAPVVHDLLARAEEADLGDLDYSAVIAHMRAADAAP